MTESILNIVTNYWFWGTFGFLIGSSLNVYNLINNGCSFPVGVITVTAGIYGGLFGSRILYILIFYPQLFSDNLPLALAFWQGTGTWLGGPLFCPIGVFIVLKIAQKPFWSNLGAFAPSLALSHAISRIGCLFSGCCYGAPTTVPWAIYSKHLDTMVHPTQIYSMVGEIFSFIILQKLWQKSENRKYLYPLYGILLAIHRFFSESFRGSDFGPEIIPGLRIYQTICVAILAICICWILIVKWEKTM